MAIKTLKQFDEYYYMTYQDILTYVVCNCSNIEDVKDIVQNIYIELYKKLNKNEKILDPKAYLIAISKNKIKDYYRFKYKNKIISLFSNNNDKEIISDIKSDINIENIILTKEEIKKVWKYLKTKKVIISKIFYLYYYNNYSIKEISKELKVTETNVKHYLYRTLHELKNYLKEEK